MDDPYVRAYVRRSPMQTNVGLAVVLLLIVLLVSCSNEPRVPVDYEVAGVVQKGPYALGTVVVVRELDESFNPTGLTYSGTISDNTGTFGVRGALSSPFVELAATGFYFNEVTGQLSGAPLTLTALADLRQATTVNVNVLTHLETGRIYRLIDDGMTLSAARDQARSELIATFRADPEIFAGAFSTLVVNEAGQGNAFLLAVSAILQGDRSVAQLSEFLSVLSTDLRSNGSIDSALSRSSLVDSAKTLDRDAVRANLEQRYELLGQTITVPNFEPFVLAFDDIAPSVSAVWPSAEALGVSPRTHVSIQFNDFMDPTTLTDSAVRLVQASSGTDIPATRSTADGASGTTVLLAPVNPLDVSTAYEILVAATVRDEAGNSMAADFAASFATIDFPTDGLVLYAPFDGSLATDGSVGVFPFTTNGTVAFEPDRFGSATGAAAFSGVDTWVDYAETESANLDGFSEITISLWVRFATAPEPGGYYAQLLSKPSAYTLDADGSFRLVSCTARGCENHRFWGTPTLTGGDATTWMHVVIEKKYGEPLVDNSNDLRIGYRSANPFLGHIDDLRIYARSLNQAEIDALFHEGGWNPQR